jgi:hypothetical protein
MGPPGLATKYRVLIYTYTYYSHGHHCELTGITASIVGSPRMASAVSPQKAKFSLGELKLMCAFVFQYVYLNNVRSRVFVRKRGDLPR